MQNQVSESRQVQEYNRQRSKARQFGPEASPEPDRLLAGKNIFQLAKIARRIPRLQKRAMGQLMRKRAPGNTLSASAVMFWRNILSDLPRVASHLVKEIKARNIGGDPFRWSHRFEFGSVSEADASDYNYMLHAPITGGVRYPHQSA